jgi:hypothetical protein
MWLECVCEKVKLHKVPRRKTLDKRSRMAGEVGMSK